MHASWIAPAVLLAFWLAPPRATAAGDATLEVPGLAAPARITTDRFGIPHLRAETRSDLYLLWGFVTARDRLWQLEHNRRAARGRLSEWFGNRALRADGGAQLFEFGTRARRIWERERRDSTVREPLLRYVAGINAYLAQCRSGARPWPEEFRRLGRYPEDWKPEDTVLGLLSLGVVLDFALPELAEGDSIRAHGMRWLETRRRFERDWMVTTIPDSAAVRLYGPSAARPGAGVQPAGARAGTHAVSGGDRAPDRPAPPRTPSSLLATARQSLGDWLSPATLEPDLRASNWFAVGPGRSASGAPLLANDPHLGLAIPGPFHVVHLSSADGADAIGACVPGLPAIVSGRNRRCAWGITALSADVVDVYADTLSADGRRVRWNGGWAPVREADFAMRFRVLDALPVPVGLLGQKRRYTPHGPVVAYDRKRRLALSVRWAGRDEDISFARLLGLERSRGAAEVAERFRSLVTPTINAIAADVDGHVIYQAVGALPKRRFEVLGPIPGDGRHEWHGLIAPYEMPRWEIPPAGFVVSGNNLPVGSAYPVGLPRYDWVHDRAARMSGRLAGDARVTLDDMRSVQNDVFSRGAERLVPRLLRCADSLAATLSPRARAALDTLRAWNHLARRDRVAPTLYRAWYGAFLRRSQLEGLPGLAAAALDGRAPEALHAPGGVIVERAAVAAVAALELALPELESLLGANLATWRWGRAHRARFAHPLAWKAPDFEPAPIPVDGDNSTPCVGASSLPWHVRVTHGPAWRHLVDLAAPDSSFGVVPPGNAGEGTHRRDHLQRWANHGYVPLYLGWDRIETVKESDWRLVPRRATGAKRR